MPELLTESALGDNMSEIIACSIIIVRQDKITMKDYPTKWTDLDFESLSWHDNVVHGIRLRNPHEGYDYDLVFDIDHILEWIETPSRFFQFIVAPATLTFRGVDKLKFNLDLGYK